jgi:pimeloyl-ACP methyl ester carboxylesterase
MNAQLRMDGMFPRHQPGDRFSHLTQIFATIESRRQVMRSLIGVVSLGLMASTRATSARSHQTDARAASPGVEETMESIVAPDGTRIAYLRAGAGPPLVLVHGTADDHTIWTPLLPQLTERFTCYAIDRRGRGGSDATNSKTYAIEREFEDVAAVVDAIGEPAFLFGHSFGALCSLEAALRTDNLQKLVLYEPPILIPPGSTGGMEGAVARMETLFQEGDLEGVVLTFAREIAQLPEEMISAVRSSPSWQMVIALAPTIVYEVRAVEGYRFDPERFEQLTTPTLLLLGSESPPYMQAATEAVAAALPHNQQVVLQDQGHLAMETAPDLLANEVIQYLAEQ